MAKVLSPHEVQVGDEKVTAESIVIATGARPRPLPGAEFDGKLIISSKEAMSLAKQPKAMLIIGAGPIGMEFGYFYNAIGTRVTVVEMVERILPGEDEEVSAALQKSLSQKGLNILTNSKTAKIEKTRGGSRPRSRHPQGKTTIEADVMLVAIGVMGNVEGLFADVAQGRARQEPHQGRPPEAAT